MSKTQFQDVALTNTWITPPPHTNTQHAQAVILQDLWEMGPGASWGYGSL